MAESPLTGRRYLWRSQWLREFEAVLREHYPQSSSKRRNADRAARGPVPARQARGSVTQTVAVLFVDPKGVYSEALGVELWDEARDARLYAGPWPVVAHPPCNKWSPLAYINQRRLPGYRIGDDGGCFEAALRAVRAFGGVLEHPALSLAWKRYDLPRPSRGSWQGTFSGGWVTEVDQGAYGHRARKRTWLYLHGGEPARLDWTPHESDVCVSGFLHHAGTNEARRVRPREAASTPPAFRDVLLGMARTAQYAAV